MPRRETINVVIADTDRNGDAMRVRYEWWLGMPWSDGFSEEEVEVLDGFSGEMSDDDELAENLNDIFEISSNVEVLDDDDSSFCGEVFAYILDPDEEVYYLHKAYPTGHGFDDLNYNNPDWWK